MYRHISVRAGGTVISSPCEISLNSPVAIRTFEATRRAVCHGSQMILLSSWSEPNDCVNVGIPATSVTLSRNCASSSRVFERFRRCCLELRSLFMSVTGFRIYFESEELLAIRGFVQGFRTEGRGSATTKRFKPSFQVGLVGKGVIHPSSASERSRIAPNRHTDAPVSCCNEKGSRSDI